MTPLTVPILIAKSIARIILFEVSVSEKCVKAWSIHTVGVFGRGGEFENQSVEMRIPVILVNIWDKCYNCHS